MNNLLPDQNKTNTQKQPISLFSEKVTWGGMVPWPGLEKCRDQRKGHSRWRWRRVDASQRLEKTLPATPERRGGAGRVGAGPGRRGLSAMSQPQEA